MQKNQPQLQIQVEMLYTNAYHVNVLSQSQFGSKSITGTKGASKRRSATAGASMFKEVLNEHVSCLFILDIFYLLQSYHS